MTTDNKEAEVTVEGGLKIDNNQYLDITNMAEDPQSMASTMMGLYTPRYLAGVAQLSSKALRRVLCKLVTYPLNDKEYKSTSTLESDVFNVGERLLEAKFMLMTDLYTKLVEEELKKENEAKETK